MVICAVIGCSNNSKYITKRSHKRHTSKSSHSEVSYYHFSKVTDLYGEKDFELRKKRLAGYLATISRADIDPALLEEPHDY